HQTCAALWERCLKLFSHTAHLNGRSLLCVRWWCCRWDDWLKALSHVSHLKGFSPVCLKPFWHTEHLYGRSRAEGKGKMDKLLLADARHWCSRGFERWETSCPHAPHLCAPSASACWD
uniref:Uncharacterized protein n=1 Tax=Nothobranchius furzeri TaxID=105023 RepID=A0A8C6PD26_NOTFU